VTFFAVNLLLAFMWAALQEMSLGNVVVGFLVGFGILALARPFVGSGGYVRSGAAFVTLVTVFLYELVVANLRLARDALRPEPRFRPAFIRVDLSDLSSNQAVLVAALVSLTPGSITVDAGVEGTEIIVHTIYAHDVEGSRRSVRRLADIVRRIGHAGRAPTAPEARSRR
jgi:multicomponent Na+:H+ antiporter subunit E